jgi:hypothetical protein
MPKAAKAALSAVLAAALLLVGPAEAAKRKKEPVRGSFSVRALPYPAVSSASGEPQKQPCVQGVYLGPAGFDFKAPYRGVLSARSEGFVGDWDLFLLRGSRIEVGSLNDQLAGGAPAKEEVFLVLDRGQLVTIQACNWLGAPDAEVAYEFVPL